MVLSPAEKVLISIVIALLVFLVTSLLLGTERKTLWFRKRKKYSLFTRRGPLGEALHFGYPVTMEGYLVTAGMLALICTGIYAVYLL